MTINEEVISKLHEYGPRRSQTGLDTRWRPSKPIKIAILDYGYDPNAKFFEDQEKNGNHGMERTVTWKDFLGDGPPEDKHQGRHGTKLLCLMLMLLPMAKIFVGRVALDKTYTKANMCAEPLARVSKSFIKAPQTLGISLTSFNIGYDRPLLLLPKYGMSMLSVSHWASTNGLSRE